MPMLTHQAEELNLTLHVFESGLLSVSDDQHCNVSLLLLPPCLVGGLEEASSYRAAAQIEL